MEEAVKKFTSNLNIFQMRTILCNRSYMFKVAKECVPDYVKKDLVKVKFLENRHCKSLPAIKFCFENKLSKQSIIFYFETFESFYFGDLSCYKNILLHDLAKNIQERIDSDILHNLVDFEHLFLAKKPSFSLGKTYIKEDVWKRMDEIEEDDFFASCKIKSIDVENIRMISEKHLGKMFRLQFKKYYLEEDGKNKELLFYIPFVFEESEKEVGKNQDFFILSFGQEKKQKQYQETASDKKRSDAESEEILWFMEILGPEQMRSKNGKIKNEKTILDFEGAVLTRLEEEFAKAQSDQIMKDAVDKARVCL